jgi:hypothetical protein
MMRLMEVLLHGGTQLNGWRSEIYATGNEIDAFQQLRYAKGEADLYAQLQFTEENVREVKAEFLGRTYYDWPDDPGPRDPNEVYVPPEGKVILLFTKPA